MDHQLFSQPNDLYSHMLRSKPSDVPKQSAATQHKEERFNPYDFNAGTVLGNDSKSSPDPQPSHRRQEPPGHCRRHPY